MSLAHHVDVAQAVALLLDAPSPQHRIYNVVDDEAVDVGALFASVGMPRPDGSAAVADVHFPIDVVGRKARSGPAGA